MDVKEAIKKFKLLFDWTPVEVSEPVEYYQAYKDKGLLFLGYQVTVVYKHHGTKSYVFGADENKMGLFPRSWALKRANQFSNQIKKQLKKRQAVKQR